MTKTTSGMRCGSAAWLLLATLACSRPQALGPVDGADLPQNDLARIVVGQPAPDFLLEDIDGRRVTLSSFRGTRHVVLVFYRGYW